MSSQRRPVLHPKPPTLAAASAIPALVVSPTTSNVGHPLNTLLVKPPVRGPPHTTPQRRKMHRPASHSLAGGKGAAASPGKNGTDCRLLLVENEQAPGSSLATPRVRKWTVRMQESRMQESMMQESRMQESRMQESRMQESLDLDASSSSLPTLTPPANPLPIKLVPSHLVLISTTGESQEDFLRRVKKTMKDMELTQRRASNNWRPIRPAVQDQLQGMETQRSSSSTMAQPQHNFQELEESSKALNDFILGSKADHTISQMRDDTQAYIERPVETKMAANEILTGFAQNEEKVSQGLLDLQEEVGRLEEQIQKDTASNHTLDAEHQFLKGELESLRNSKQKLVSLQQEVDEDTTEIIPSAMKDTRFYTSYVHPPLCWNMEDHCYSAKQRLGGGVCEDYPARAQNKNIEDYPRLKGWLPDKFPLHVCGYEEEVAPLGDHTGFVSIVRVDVRTVEQAKEWVRLVKESSGVTWRVEVTQPRVGICVLFKKRYRCQHKVMGKRQGKQKSKNTGCQATMAVTLKNRGMFESKDPHIPHFPLRVRIVNRHNHDLHVGDAIRYRDVGQKAIDTLTGLFAIGHTPPSALAVLKHDIKIEQGDNYVYAAGNREICPDMAYVQRLFKKVSKDQLGTQSGPSMVEALRKQVETYNEKCQDSCAVMGTSSQGAPLIAVCSPLMKKVHHQLKHSGELCFIDSSGNMDRKNMHVFLLLTHSPAGGLPLGIFFCQSEDEETIFEGLQLLKNLIGERAFAGRGAAGPQVFITDDCTAERGALGRAFPLATPLLCSFHLLQAVWRWLWSKESLVECRDRPTLFTVVKEMLYSKEIAEVDRLYLEAREHPVAVRYEKYLRYIERLYSRRECWALSYRDSCGLLTRGINTNNFAEAAMRVVLKDKILQKTKAFNPGQVFDLLTSRLDVYYEARIVDVALGRWEAYQKRRFLPQDCNHTASQIQQLEDNTYEVKGSVKAQGTYIVDMEMELCSCPVGQTGAPCKHLAAVAKFYSVDMSSTFLPTSPEMRAEMLKLTSGEATPPGPSSTPMEKMHQAEATPGPSSTPMEQLQETDDDDSDLAEVISDMRRRSRDPLFTAGFKAMSKQYLLLKRNPSAMLSALHTYGKSGSLSTTRAATLRPAARRQGPIIGCQPTAVARRKLPAGSRRRVPAGRPGKQHNLSASVALNTSGAKKH